MDKTEFELGNGPVIGSHIPMDVIRRQKEQLKREIQVRIRKTKQTDAMQNNRRLVLLFSVGNSWQNRAMWSRNDDDTISTSVRVSENEKVELTHRLVKGRLWGAVFSRERKVRKWKANEAETKMWFGEERSIEKKRKRQTFSRETNGASKIFVFFVQSVRKALISWQKRFVATFWDEIKFESNKSSEKRRWTKSRSRTDEDVRPSKVSRRVRQQKRKSVADRMKKDKTKVFDVESPFVNPKVFLELKVARRKTVEFICHR